MKREIVCLCGSTRFYDAFQKANYDETMAGRIVLTVGHYPHNARPPMRDHGETLGCTADQKAALDVLHLDKIDIASRILVLNVGGYIGESTSRELAYAIMTHKMVTFLDPAAGEKFMEDNTHRLGAIMAEHMRTRAAA